jgi:hypothetical protein
MWKQQSGWTEMKPMNAEALESRRFLSDMRADVRHAGVDRASVYWGNCYMAGAVRLIDIHDKNHDSLRVEQSIYLKLNWII